MNRFIEDLRKVPVLRVLAPLVLGILLERIWSADQFPFWLIFVSLCLIILALFCDTFLKWRVRFSPYLIPVALFLLFLSAGIFQFRWIGQQEVSVIQGDQLYISGIISSDPEEKEKSIVVTMEIEYFTSKDSVYPGKNKVMLYLPKDSLVPNIYPGERWLFRGMAREIKNNGNPGEFDYSAYMLRKGIRSIIFAESGSAVKLSPAPKNKLRYIPGNLRRRIRSSWDMRNPDLAVLSAITLGDKSMIPLETREDFVGSGAMHLLAVSGLHVGMIWWILDLLIAFPRRKATFRILKVVLILGILWMYAGITGFSESVSRSVTMFSLISVARAVSRNSNIYNTLFLSAFILLLIDPLRLEEPGFQLSYLAVFGIVTIHPLLERMLPVSNRILKRVTDLVFVSIAAQLATLPVSLIYFHQFPVYFIFTNILAIPLVSVLLALFVVFSPFFILDFHPEFFSWILEKISHILNLVVELISSLPGSAVREIPMSLPAGLLLILLTFSLCGFAIYKRVVWLILSTCFASCLLIFSGILQIPDASHHEMHIYNFRKYTAISTISQNQYCDYIFYDVEMPDRYVSGYLQSRGKMSRKCKKYIHYEIGVNDSSRHLNNPLSLGDNSITQICKGAWGMVSAGKKILVCGGCRGPDLDKILADHSWDIVIFRNACPRISEEQADLLRGVACVADGSLRHYELSRIKAIIPGVYIASEAGALSMINH